VPPETNLKCKDAIFFLIFQQWSVAKWNFLIETDARTCHIFGFTIVEV